MNTICTIRKARLIPGHTIVLREVEPADAEFILSLRLDPKKSKYLGATSSRLVDQVNWIKRYKERSGEAYFIICDLASRRLGCIRMYNAEGESFHWGSWLMIDGLSPMVSIESAVLVYAYGRHLGFLNAKLDVLRINRHACNFHEKLFGAEVIQVSDDSLSYVVRAERIDVAIAKYGSHIPMPLNVVYHENPFSK